MFVLYYFKNKSPQPEGSERLILRWRYASENLFSVSTTGKSLTPKIGKAEITVFA